MALRRLLSGWLIAMAALARSLAQALERASEDRSASAPDPVMAALAERYPGAPAHWLAHVAERTSQLADTGEAPFSLNSDPTAWPAARPDGLASRPLATEDARVATAPRRMETVARRIDEAPSLAALRDRPSEVWRRPDPEPRRRPRPVFAAAPPPEKQAGPVAAFDAPPPRPRARLTVVNTSPEPAPSAPEPTTPPSASPVTKPIVRPLVWSEAPPLRTAVSNASEAPANLEVGVKASPRGYAFAQASLTRLGAALDEPQGKDPGAASGSPAARRRTAWFFAGPPSVRPVRALDLSTESGRQAREGKRSGDDVVAADPPPHPAFSHSTSEVVRRAAEPEKAWQALTPPKARRPLFQILSALSGAPHVDRVYAPEAMASTERPVEAEVGGRPPSEAPPTRSGLTVSPLAAERATRSSPVFPLSEGEAPLRPVKGQEATYAAVQRIQRPSKTSGPTGEARGEDKRPHFNAPRPPATRPATRRFVDRPSDDRWPALPPTTLAGPPGVEAAPPRWDQLAREQEEGRWNV